MFNVYFECVLNNLTLQHFTETPPLTSVLEVCRIQRRICRTSINPAFICLKAQKHQTDLRGLAVTKAVRLCLRQKN